MKLKIIYALVFISCLCSCSKSVDEIISNAIKSKFGQSNIRELHSLFMSSNKYYNSNNMTIKVYIDEPDNYRRDYISKNYTTYRVHSNYGCVANDTSIIKLQKEGVQSLKTQIAQYKDFFIPPVFNYKINHMNLKYDGIEKTANGKAYKLIDKSDSLVQMAYLFDTENYNLVKVTTTNNFQNKNAMYEILYNNFRMIHGFNMPFTIEFKVANAVIQRLELDSLKINEKLDSTLFLFPENLVEEKR